MQTPNEVLNAKKLRAFQQLGFLARDRSGSELIGDCLLCGKQNHFYLNHTKLLWSCKHCGKSGNVQGFMAAVAEQNKLQLPVERVRALARDRKLPEAAFLKWNFGWDVVHGAYTLPILSSDGAQVCDVRHYSLSEHQMLSTAGGEAGLIGVEALLHTKRTVRVWVCEGEWDTVALRWLAGLLSKPDVVVGVPGASVFKDAWLPLFSQRPVVLAYDADHAGEQGALRAAQKLQRVTKQLSFVAWPSSAPNGWDVRDLVTTLAVQQKKPRACWQALLKCLADKLPVRQANGITPIEKEEEPAAVRAAKPLPHIGHSEVYAAYEKWLDIPDRTMLDLVYGALFANRIEGDPLWLFMAGPPGSLKSELLMSFSDCPEAYTTTSLTPHSLISGWSVGPQQADPSILPQLDGKVLIVKDFTTILTMNSVARDEVFGVLRDAYDGTAKKVFGNGVVREYTSHFGFMAGVTPTIDAYSILHTSMGERFLKYRMPDASYEEELKQARRALSNVGYEVRMRQALREAAVKCLSRTPAIPKVPKEMHDRIIACAQFTALLRGVVLRETYTDYIVCPPIIERATRLSKQLAKLAMGVAMFKGQPQLQESVLPVLRRIALDTPPAREVAIVKAVHALGGAPDTASVAVSARLPRRTVLRVLQDMHLRGVLEQTGEDQLKHLWQLSPRMGQIVERSGVFNASLMGQA